jgi:Zn-dependent protease with chaperone function
MRVKPRWLPLTLATLLVACGGVGFSASPSGSAPAAKTVDAGQVERLKRVMVPLINGMNRPLSLNKVQVAFSDDDHINAANAGQGQFVVTRGLVDKANDDHLRGVLAHELAHEDLGHVAKAQTLGTGVNIGIALLEQIFPGSSAVTPLAGKLIVNRYTQKEEYAADRHGADILQRAGYRRDLMAETLIWLMQVEGGGSGGFFATHPATDDRIQALSGVR